MELCYVPCMPSRRRHRGYIRTLPSGSFQAIAYASTDPLTGRERYLRETAATYAGAEKALTLYRSKIRMWADDQR
jgi:hypothetical protein